MSVQIHHIAAVSGDLQKTIAFYHGVLGLNFIRKASLLDGPKVCHFYWSKQIETFITFYHCPGLYANKQNFNTNGAISFSVNREAKIFWMNRFKAMRVHYSIMYDETEGSEIFSLKDPDGLRIKFIFISDGIQSTSDHHRLTNYAIKGIYGIQIVSVKPNSLISLFVNQFKMMVQQYSQNKYRFYWQSGEPSIIDLNANSEQMPELVGCGRIHHVALKILNWKHYVDLQNYFEQQNQNTIFKKHPNNYSALYFWKDGDLLFEIVGQRPSPHKRGFLNFKQHLPDISRKSQLR